MGFFSISTYVFLAHLAVAARAEEESAVLNATKDNWDTIIGKSKYTLVKFFAPWCGHCKAMAEDYITAAKKLKEKGTDVTLAEVDATVETELATKWEVQGYPTLYWFIGENKKEYTGARTADGIVEWIEANMGPALKTWTQDDLHAALAKRKWGEAIVAFKGDKTVVEVAEKIADEGKVFADIVYVVSGEKSCTINKGTSETESYSGSEWGYEQLNKFVLDNRAPLFGQINEDNFEIYVEQAKQGLFWVCFDPANHAVDVPKYSPAIVEAAKANAATTTKYPFVWLDISEFEAHAKEELGCTSYPTIVLQKGDLLGDREDTKVEKFVRSFSETPDELTAAAVATFFDDIEKGKLEPVPEPDELAELDEEDGDEEEGVPTDGAPEDDKGEL